MQWHILLNFFAGGFARILRSQDKSSFLLLNVTNCDLFITILSLHTLRASHCILRAIQVLCRMIKRAYGVQL